MIIRRMRIACWIKRLQTQTQNYKILTALVLQQWSQENFLVPRHTYTQPFLLTVLTFLFLLKYGDEGRIKAIEVCTYRTNVSQFFSDCIETLPLITKKLISRRDIGDILSEKYKWNNTACANIKSVKHAKHEISNKRQQY